HHPARRRGGPRGGHEGRGPAPEGRGARARGGPDGRGRGQGRVRDPGERHHRSLPEHAGQRPRRRRPRRQRPRPVRRHGRHGRLLLRPLRHRPPTRAPLL
ncbi:MAG: Energy conserving hydrogenase Ehb protein Q, partial [uncultured Rubrobacteraceae bacterium]